MRHKLKHAPQIRPPDPAKAVALKALRNIADHWSLTIHETAQLADMSDSTWKRARAPRFTGDLTQDQMLRLSVITGIYKSLELFFGQPLSRQWIKLHNSGPEFEGACPLDAMIAGGLPKMLRVRSYLDALRGGV